MGICGPTGPRYEPNINSNIDPVLFSNILKELEGMLNIRCYTGARGVPGVAGVAGVIGHTGARGVPGTIGHTGPRGMPGIIGHTGARGFQGMPGFRGNIGNTGPKGDKGDKGDRGDRGDIGNTGPKGDRGDIGNTGPQGPIGLPYFGDPDLQSVGVGVRPVGKSSVSVGYGCGHDTSSNTVNVGFRTGTVTSQGYNTHIGAEAGRYNYGTQCVYVGDGVCSATGAVGSHNTFIGSESGLNNTSGFCNLFSGAVAGSANTEGSWNVFLGPSAGQNNKIGTNNLFVGANAGLACVAGNSCICLGDNADTSSDIPMNQIVIGQGTTSFGDNTITFPHNLRTFPHGTEVNFSSPNGGCLYPVSSSIRWKDNVHDINEDIDTSKIYDLRPVTFTAMEGHGDTKQLNIGLIAEEVEKYLPIIVPKDDKGCPASVRYSLLSVLLLAEIKKLKARVEELTNITKDNNK